MLATVLKEGGEGGMAAAMAAAAAKGPRTERCRLQAASNALSIEMVEGGGTWLKAAPLVGLIPFEGRSFEGRSFEGRLRVVRLRVVRLRVV